MNFRHLGQLAVDNAPHILTYLAAAGVVTTTVLAVTATPKAMQVIKEHGQPVEYDEDDGSVTYGEVSRKEALALTWKFYLPAALVGGATIACIIGANTVHSKRQAALVAGYSLVQRGYQEYQEKVIETIGEKKEEEIRADVAKDRLEALEKSGELVMMDNGRVLTFDSYSGRAFWSEGREAIRKAENDIVAGINNFMYASLNDFYRRIGLKANDAGEIVGFNNDNQLSIAFSSMLVNDTPALAIDFHNEPVPNFHKIW